jgi:gluconate 2-dehydrogenase gamma chain
MAPGNDRIGRRVFLQRVTFFGGGTLLYACTRHPKDAREAAHGPHRHAEVLTTSHRSFTDPEWAVLVAAVDRVLPRDEDPGALDAHVPDYIDRMLQSPELTRMRDDFIEGLAALDRRARGAHEKGFAELSAEEKDALLTAFKDSGPGTGEEHFYELLIALSLEGFLGDPSYGGNHDHVGWRLVGFSTTEPPKGYDGTAMLLQERP